jgi:hypothetical protein
MGMILKRRDRDPHGKHHRRKADEQPAQVPYKLASYEHDHEGKRFKSSHVAFSFWSASKYVLVLSLMLWWLPFFGQMIAGYVGGRRAGGPWKGVAASIFPVVLLYIVVAGFESGTLPSHIFGVAIAPSVIGASLAHNIPFIAPYVEFSNRYVGDFMSALEGSSPYGINPYVLTVAFAYVGGVIAEQHRRELEFASGSVVSSTTVLVHDSSQHHQRAVEMQPQVQNAGVLTALGSHMHWPWRHQYEQANAYFPRRHRDEWARAVNMRYIEDDEEEAILPRYYADDGRYLGKESRRRKRRLSRSGDDEQEDIVPWKQKRRGRPNFSSKPRFSHPKYADDSLSGGYGARTFMRRKSPSRLTVGAEPRSIRRARKFMEKDWGGRQDRAGSLTIRSRRDDEDYVDAEATTHNRRHHNRNDWDAI